MWSQIGGSKGGLDGVVFFMLTAISTYAALRKNTLLSFYNPDGLRQAIIIESGTDGHAKPMPIQFCSSNAFKKTPVHPSR